MILSSPGDAPPAPLAGLSLTLGWLLVLAGWALWNAIALPGRALGGYVALGFLLLVAILAGRAVAGTSNPWLATLSTWQWVALPAAFLIARQLTAEPDDARGLVAVLVATGVAALAVHVAPLLSGVFGIHWPTTIPQPRLHPQDHEPITQITGANILELRSWSGDILCLALAAPASLMLALGARAMPMWRDRLLACVPLGFVVAGLAARFMAHPPPAPPSWEPAMRLATAAPLGIGSGLYDRFAARYNPPESEIVITEPPNSFVGVAAAGGWAALAALVGTFGLVAWSLRRPPPLTEPPAMPEYRPHWELHLGAAAGIVVAVVLQVQDWPTGFAAPIVALGFSAGVRALIWYAVYFCAEGCLLTGLLDRVLNWGLLAAAIGAGAYDVLRPGMADLFAVAAALAINLNAPLALAPWSGGKAARWLPLALTIALLGGFVATALIPAVASTTYLRKLARDVPQYAPKLDLLQDQKDPASRAAAHSSAVTYLRHSIRQPLLDAMNWNPRDPTLRAVLVPWLVDFAEHRAAYESALRTTEEPDVEAVAMAQRAQELDSEGVQGFLAEFQARVRLVAGSSKNRTEHLAKAGDLIALIVHREPALEARLRLHLASAYFTVKDKGSGLKEAQAALALDDRATAWRYRLNDDERRQIATWLAPK